MATTYLTLTNNGSAYFNGGTATLSVDGPYLSIVDDAISVEGLASGESITIAYEVLLDADAPSSTAINLVLAVTEGVFEQTSDLVFETPMCQSTDLNILITINTDSWGYETSWNLTTGGGVELASVSGSYESNSSYETLVCAAEGTTMTFNIQDSYGDGIYSPNGYWITVCGNQVAQGDAFGSGTSETFVVTCDVFVEVPGCMDSEADNYNADANLDDGSCIPSVRVCNGVDDCIDGFDEIDCDCSEMNEPQCNQYGDCDWVVDSINCSSLTTEFSCNSNGCDWNINIDSYGCSQFDNNPSQCSQTYGCNWTWCAAQWEDCCSGWWQIDNSYCYGESGYCEENLYESGDINQDGSIDIGDIILTVGFILDGQYNNSADLDSNDIVNILDIILIIHIILN
mgnify:CR=1 FL=1